VTACENVLFSLELREDYNSRNKEDVVNGLLGMVDILEAKNAYPADLSMGYKRAVANRPRAGRAAAVRALRRAHDNG